jgi:prevent-host-death family protein
LHQFGGSVRYSSQIKPISYLKANAAEVLEEQRRPLISTQNGEAKAVLQDVALSKHAERDLESLLARRLLGV